MDRILLWAGHSQDQWIAISTELSRQTQRIPLHPSQRSRGCSSIIEEKEVSLSWWLPSRTGPIRLRRCNHHSHDDLQQDLADRRVANPMDPVLVDYTSLERQLPNTQPHQPPKQSHAEGHTEQIEAAGREDLCWRTGRSTTKQGPFVWRVNNFKGG